MSDINERIKELRKSQQPKMSQGAFGERLGMSRDAINNLENGRVEPPVSSIKLICATYNVSFAWLKDGIGPMILPPDTADERVDKLMLGSNEFAKSVVRSFVKTADEHPAFWDLLKAFVDNLIEDTKKSDR